jgi:MFS family permease
MSAFKDTYHYIRRFSPTFWLVITATLLNQTGNMAFVFLLVYLNQHAGLSLAQSSFTFAVFSASMLATGILCGSLIDRIGSGRIMILSLLLNGLVLITFPFLHAYMAILGICMLWGITFGIYRPASQALVSSLSTPGMHKVTFSVFRLAQNLGMSIGPALGGYLAFYSFPALFFVNGAANLLACCILFFSLFRTIYFKTQSDKHYRAPINLKWLRHDISLRIFMLGMIPVSMVFFQHESTLAVFLKADLHLPLSFYGWLFTINTLLIVSMELVLNVFMLNWPYRTNFILGSALITAGFAGLSLATQAWHVILLTLLWTFGEMILYPSASSYIADIAPVEHRGSYMSLFSTSSNIGLFFGPWAGAALMGHIGGRGLWLACGLWGILSLVIFYFTREPVRITHQP